MTLNKVHALLSRIRVIIVA